GCTILKYTRVIRRGGKMTDDNIMIVDATYTVDLGDGLVKVIPLKVEFNSDGSFEIELPEEIAALPRNPASQWVTDVHPDEETRSWNIALPLEDWFLGFEELKARWRRELFEVKREL